MQPRENRWMELGRRLVLILAIVAAALCYMWFDSFSLIKISEYKEKKDVFYPKHSADSLLFEEENGGVARKGEDSVLNRENTIMVSGNEWQTFFTEVIDCFESDRPIKGWEHRVDGMYREGWSLFSL